MGSSLSPVTANLRSREGLAWVAGFWDGEGSVSCLDTKTSLGYPVFAIGQSGDEAVALLARVRDAVQIHCSITGPYTVPSRPHYKPKYELRISGFANVQALLAMCWPWLSETKKAQALRAIARFHYTHPVAPLRTHCPRCSSEWVEPNIVYNPANRSWRCRVCRRKNPDAARPAGQYRRKLLDADVNAPERRTRHPQRVRRD